MSANCHASEVQKSKKALEHAAPDLSDETSKTQYKQNRKQKLLASAVVKGASKVRTCFDLRQSLAQNFYDARGGSKLKRRF